MRRNISRFLLFLTESIDTLIEGHKEAPHLRALQRKLAEELTTFTLQMN
jgi:tyrosyl-tRNA synthetase